jgi:hypothetical protein
MQQDTSDILFTAFKNALIMKGFICFTDIFIELDDVTKKNDLMAPLTA